MDVDEEQYAPETVGQEQSTEHDGSPRAEDAPNTSTDSSNSGTLDDLESDDDKVRNMEAVLGETRRLALNGGLVSEHHNALTSQQSEREPDHLSNAVLKEEAIIRERWVKGEGHVVSMGAAGLRTIKARLRTAASAATSSKGSIFSYDRLAMKKFARP